MKIDEKQIDRQEKRKSFRRKVLRSSFLHTIKKIVFEFLSNGKYVFGDLLLQRVILVDFKAELIRAP